MSGRGELRGLIYVTLAVAVFSTSSVVVRLAAPLSPSAIAFGRLAVAALAIGLLARRQRAGKGKSRSKALSRSELPRFALYGLFAALHFILFVASLSYTTIAHSLALVYTSPVFVTFFSAVLLKERLRPRQWLGIPVVIAGVAALAGFEPQMSLRMALGDLMALGSAVAYGLYSVAGRRERSTYSLFEYAGAVYLFAALWLAPVAAATWTGGLSLRTLAAVIYQGLFPLAIGHTLYNASLRRVHPTYVNLVSTQEVTGGILLGWLLLGEGAGPSTLLGAGLSLFGVVLVLLL